MKKVVIMVALTVSLMSFAQSDSGRGRHQQFYVVPAPNTVTIDGKLDDWDLSAQIEMFVIEATRSTQSAKIAAMYDNSAFYLSGEINDPTPMMNRHDPKVKPERAWDADAVQFRMTIDPKAGYPVRESTFEYKRDKSKIDTRDDIVHLLLWHYTDDGTANLQMRKGMTYRLPHPDWLPDGLVPRDKFDGVYRKRDDGLGYTFEYRIPWSTFGADQPLTGGDTVAGTVNVLWSRPDGLAHIRMSGAAYDIMGEPGFPFQKTECWGKVIFSETGNIPRELVAAGLPPERQMPLEFSYELPADGETTIQLFSENGTAARILVPQQPRVGGRNTERWDGLDDAGNLLPAGPYRWRGVFFEEPLRAEFRFSVHNSGRPPYTTDDGKGGWGGDHGVPRDVAALRDGMLLVWDTAEYGSGTIRVDLEGTKQWGTQSGAMHIATDGKRYYTVGDHGFHRGLNIRIFEVDTARPTKLTSETAEFSPPPGGDDRSNHVTGLAWGADILYASYRDRDLVALFSTTDGTLKTTWKLPAPQRLAVRPDGSLAVVSGNQVLSVKDGKASQWLMTNLDEPQGIAVAGNGAAYVANRGELQNVSVFGSDGKYLRSIGRSGGRPRVGQYDRSGMLDAGGIALDTKENLWVAETLDGPKRISVWNTATGENIDEFFGASNYFAYGFIDTARPDEILAHDVLWEIDWATNTTRPKSTIWRPLQPNMVPAPGTHAYQNIPRLITTVDGKQYLYGNTRSGSILMRRDGDIFKPFAALFESQSSTGIAVIDENKEKWQGDKRKPPVLLWQDTDDDQIVQEKELSQLADDYTRARFAWLEKDLSVRLSTGQIWRPAEFTSGQLPVYDPKQAEKAVAAAGPGIMALTDDNSLITFNHVQGPSLVKRAPNGDMLWNYPDLIAWRNTLNMPLVRAGRLWAMTGLMGVAGEFFAHQTYWGANQLFRTDGQYIGAILNDRRLVGRGPYAGQSEGQGGSFVKLNLDGKDRYFAVGGSNDVRVWEVHGLSGLQDLAGGSYVHTGEQVAKAKAAKEAYEASLAGKKELRIVAGGKEALDKAPAVSRDVEGDRGFKARLANDDKNLYVRFDVRTPHGLINSTPDERIIFRGGNLLDIQLAANPAADPKRQKPAAGDVRLLVTRRPDDNAAPAPQPRRGRGGAEPPEVKGKPFAVLFQPKIERSDVTAKVLTSPTGQESFDRIEVVEVGLDYEKTADGFTATVTIPLNLLNLTLDAQEEITMDLGYLFGNDGGTRIVTRAYLFNNSFTANIVDDIPHESRLEPAEWGKAKLIHK